MQWHNAVVSNVNAYNADVNDGAACMSPYEPEHNTDMLIYAANMAGEVFCRLDQACGLDAPRLGLYDWPLSTVCEDMQLPVLLSLCCQISA